MLAQAAIQLRMHEALFRLKDKNPRISTRAFALNLGLSPSAVSEILKNKRKVSKKMALQILMRLNLEDKEIQSILELFPKKGGTNQEYFQLNMDQFGLISDWYHYGILSLMQTEDFRNDPAWISRRLGITVHQTESAIKRLKRLGLLKTGSNGKFKPSDPQYTTSTDVASVALRRSHKRNLQIAAKSLDNDDVSVRDFTAITMVFDPKKLKEAKTMIREFRRSFSEYNESYTKKEVYKLCIQFFPLTKPVEAV